jgi:hypothetical protein
LNEQLSRYDNRFGSYLSPIGLDDFIAGQIGLALQVRSWQHDRFTVPAGWAEWVGGWATKGRVGEERVAGWPDLSQDSSPWTKGNRNQFFHYSNALEI